MCFCDKLLLQPMHGMRNYFFQATIREEFTEPTPRQTEQLQKSSTRRHSPPLHTATSREGMWSQCPNVTCI